MRWTNAQQRAIELSGNGIVSAAAGAGKTAVLTERVVRLCMKRVPLSAMLVLTFTRAAAAEMKERIAASLQAAARAERDPETKRFLAEQADSIGSSNISTIHSFCRRVITRHFQAARLSPAGRTMEEGESKVMRAEAMDRALGELAAGEAETYRRLVASFDSEAAASAAAQRLYEFLSALPEPLNWLEAAVSETEDEAGLLRDKERLLELYCEELYLAAEDFKAARRTLSPAMEVQRALLDDELARIGAALIQTRLEDYMEACEAVPFDTLRFPKGTTDADKKPVQNARDEVKRVIRRQQKRLGDINEQARLQKRAATGLRALQRLTVKFAEVYSAMKEQKQVLDFSDLEHMALKVLKDERIRDEYRERIREIIVDEYQDGNHVQEAILQAVSRGGNIFLVGDVKQSIYGFRQAEPRLFLNKLSEYQRVELSENFRSSEQVLNAANHVFKKLMRRPISPLDYDEASALKAGMEQPEGRVSLHLIESASERDGDELKNSEFQAKLVAKTIAERIESNNYEYRDFVILLRNMTHANQWVRTLALQGIPAYAQASGGYFDTMEVKIAINLLRLIDNRRQDIPLLSVMRSPFGNFSDEELARLRIGRPDGDILDCLLAAEERNEEKAVGFLNMLDRLKRESGLCTLSELIAEIFDETSFYDEVGAVFGGAQRQANLNALIDRAAEFDASMGGGITEFLEYLESVEKNAKTGASQTAQSNVVRIMTMHRAKGLEFPVVFLGNLEAGFGNRGPQEVLRLNSSYGISMRFVDPIKRVRYEPLRFEVLKKEARKSLIEEETRLLYVAMTRAKRELFMVGSMKNAFEAVQMPAPASLARLSSSTSHLDWLRLCLNDYLPIETHDKAEFSAFERTPVDEARPKADAGILAALKARLEWEYPYKAAAGYRTKTSVTALGGLEEPKPPAETGEKGAPGALARGSATHALLRHIGSRGASREELVELLAQAPFRDAYAEDVLWFLSSPLYRRLQNSVRAEHELSFTYAVGANELYGVESTETVLVQGIIDCCFLEDGGWVLLDYKTDYVRGEVRAAAMAHSRQLELYAKALSELTDIPIRDKYVVMLRAHEEVLL
ncbi:MAG: UvrD-helicase domain-containing protein [Clostridia bacterium]|nr:UvrD-helicase domain-containing protein [Clostridia bacterium]